MHVALIVIQHALCMHDYRYVCTIQTGADNLAMLNNYCRWSCNSIKSNNGGYYIGKHLHDTLHTKWYSNI